MDLSVDFCGVRFENPTVLASGFLGVTGNSLKMVARAGAGGVTTKSIWRDGHPGHPNPTMISTEHWTLNAVGLPDAGIEKAKEELAEYRKDCLVPLIVNIVGGKKQEFIDIAEAVMELKPELLEVNLSCPNVEEEFGKPFACDITAAAGLTREIKKHTGSVPVIVKLSPNVSNIGEIAKACADAGADGFTAINTVGPGMAIDIEQRAPILANKVGGVSGPAIKPIAVKCIYDVYKATGLPIIGTGGVISGRDAIELIMAGAALIGVGTALVYHDLGAFKKITGEMAEWCDAHGVASLSEIVGAAHPKKDPELDTSST